MTVRAVLFDFFGTLTPGLSPEVLRVGHHRVARCLGVPEATYTRTVAATWAQRCTGEFGDLSATLRRLAVDSGGSPADVAVGAACSARVESIRELTRLRPEAAQVCGDLARRGLRLGLVSDCTHELPEIWPSLPVAPYFDATVFSIEAGTRKPDPAMFITACDALGVTPAECLYVGDGGGNELTGATSVGMWAVQIAAPDNTGALMHDRERDWHGAKVTHLRAIPALLDSARPESGAPA